MTTAFCGWTDRPTAAADGLQTEFAFVLPRGYVDGDGVVHREGSMRLATARDEIYPQSDPRVRENPAYLTVLLLTRDDHRGSGRCPRSTRSSSRACSPPTSPSCRTSTAGSTRRATRQAAVTCPSCATSSRWTSPVMRRGNRDVRDRPPVRGGRVRRLLPPLAARRRSSTSSTRCAAGSSTRSARSTDGSRRRTEGTCGCPGRSRARRLRRPPTGPLCPTPQ